ncbi:MAG: proline dehydrogenase [Chitinophagales bacterium]|nr:proline dehydrogenase [Chitinophagales bacterium]
MSESVTLFEDTKVAFADKSMHELKREHFFFNLVKNKKLVTIGSALTEFGLKIGLPLAPIFKHTVFEHFVGGETLEDSRGVIEQLGNKKIGSLINYGVEGEDSEKDFDRSLNENLNALRFCRSESFARGVCIKITGIARSELLEKIQAGKKLSVKENREVTRAQERFTTLCEEAVKCDTILYIDAEEYWIQKVLDEWVLSAMKKYNKEKAVIFDTLQMYRWDQIEYLENIIDQAEKDKFHLGLKLVRGAYMEKERNRAERLGYPSPIQESKANTDKDFNKAIEICIQHIDRVEICVATHNEESCYELTLLVEQYNIPKNHPHIQLAQLYGMGDHITYNLAAQGYNANKYLPYGPVKNVIPYLIRRASENSSVEGQIGRELSLIQTELERRRTI